MDLTRELMVARIAGRAAGAEALRLQSGVETQDKADGSPVSAGDLAADRIIRSAIQQAFPEDAILSEEVTDSAARQSSRRLWIIDPIDGTTNYLRGIPAWAISIALCEPRRDGLVPRWGIVYDPTRDEAFTAEDGSGAWCNGKRIYASPCARLEDALLASALPFRFPEHLPACGRVHLDIAARCEDHRRGGAASLDLAYVAAGRLDGYYELAIWPWDVAAGELLVRCAGGVATDYRGGVAGVTTRRSIVAAGTPELHAQLLAAVAPLAEAAASLPGPA